MFIQLNIEMDDGEIKTASANKDCDLKEAKADIFRVLRVAKEDSGKDVHGWDARFCDFDSSAQVLVFGEKMGEAWVCKLKFVGCTEHHVEEAMNAWAVTGFKPKAH